LLSLARAGSTVPYFGSAYNTLNYHNTASMRAESVPAGERCRQQASLNFCQIQLCLGVYR
jgi:hypothetical protein